MTELTSTCTSEVMAPRVLLGALDAVGDHHGALHQIGGSVLRVE